MNPDSVTAWLNRFSEKSGFPHIHPHAFRHTFATRALEQGMDAKTLSMLLGHFSVAFTQDTYTHVLDAHKWESMH